MKVDWIGVKDGNNLPAVHRRYEWTTLDDYSGDFPNTCDGTHNVGFVNELEF